MGALAAAKSFQLTAEDRVRFPHQCDRGGFTVGENKGLPLCGGDAKPGGNLVKGLASACPKLAYGGIGIKLIAGAGGRTSRKQGPLVVVTPPQPLQHAAGCGVVTPPGEVAERTVRSVGVVGVIRALFGGTRGYHQGDAGEALAHSVAPSGRIIGDREACGGGWMGW